MIFDWKTEIHRYHRYFVELQGLTEKKSVRSFFNLTLTLLTISFFAFFAIRPTLVIIASLKREIETKQEINSKLQEKIVSLVNAQEEYSLSENRFYLLDQTLPPSSDFPLLILSVEKEASASGVQLSSLSLGKVEIIGKGKGSQNPSFEFTFLAEGDYKNLKEFLARVENLRRSINFTSASLTKTKKEKEETVKIRLSVTGEANFYPEDKL